MLIQITTISGELVLVPDARVIVYVKLCPYLDHEFQTQDSRQKFCCDKHRVMHFKKNRAS